ncbi:MAG: hypothetical protein IJB64_01240 [Akkermansia sp.]|nr:hypothetical protein [Akkermansia sp.]
MNSEAYGYDYDNVGNRLNSPEGDNTTAYMSNNLNQYTSIQEASEANFTPQFDADGNQTLIKTETGIGIWTAVYNAENRPVSFTNEATGTVVTCAYVYLGRQYTRMEHVYP